ncbi:MAG: class I SAM-dependent methyltransferase [Fuerstiella sp.]
MSLQTQNHQSLPAYFDRMIEAFHAGTASRHAHLGHWNLDERGTPIDNLNPGPDALERAQARLNGEVIQRGNVVSGTRILDVACGFGGLAEALGTMFHDLEITGINIDLRQLEICQRLQSTKSNALRWQEADACDLPFADAAFDTVFCIEAMFHFASRKRFLDEVRRVLKPGGTLVTTDILLVQDPQMPQFCFDAMLNDGYGPWPDPWCENGDAEDLLNASAHWSNVQQYDATQNTLPTYQYIVPQTHFAQGDSPTAGLHHRDPGDQAVRSAMMLHWLHQNGRLKYVYTSAVAGAES